MSLRKSTASRFRTSAELPGSVHRSALEAWAAGACRIALAMCLAAGLAMGAVQASIVVDAGTGAVLEEHHADELTYPASLTKLMTLYLVFGALRRGTLRLDEKLLVSRHAAAQPPTKLGLRPGGFISVEQCILGIVTHSANDAAVVLAEGVAGSEQRFASLMNEQARQLGMSRTTFRNASGLPNAFQKTTARDMATIAVALISNFPGYYHFFDVRDFTFGGRRFYSFDHVLSDYPGADGMKTGYTSASGFNLVTSAVRGQRRLVGVVLGENTSWARERLMIALLNQAFLREAGATLTKTGSPAEARGDQAPAQPDAVSSLEMNEVNAHTAHDWAIQVGGIFRNPRAVRRVLESARRTAPALRHAKALVIEAPGRNRYRARFAEMTQQRALSSCGVLRRRHFTCMPFHIPVSVASAGQ